MTSFETFRPKIIYYSVKIQIVWDENKVWKLKITIKKNFFLKSLNKRKEKDNSSKNVLSNTVD